MTKKLVVDTNVLVASLSSRSKHHWFVQALVAEHFEVFVTTDIVFEYEEVLTQKYSEDVAVGFIAALRELPSVYFTQVHYYWNLLGDPDDNKFIDCYVASTADYLITNDKDFRKVLNLRFPKINLLSIEEAKPVLAIS